MRAYLYFKYRRVFNTTHMTTNVSLYIFLRQAQLHWRNFHKRQNMSKDFVIWLLKLFRLPKLEIYYLKLPNDTMVEYTKPNDQYTGFEINMCNNFTHLTSIRKISRKFELKYNWFYEIFSSKEAVLTQMWAALYCGVKKWQLKF